MVNPNRQGSDPSMDDILHERRQIRKKERDFRRKGIIPMSNLPTGAQEGNVSALLQLMGTLPPHMRPGNVGSYNKVTWPYWNQVNFDFGVNPTWTAATKQTQSFQVSQEAAFILMSITRKAYTYSTASELAPLQLEIRDRQSSRQLNDRPIPLQMIGKRSRPTILPTPMLIMPNAFIDLTLTSWITGSQATVGNGKHQISFFGYRVRVEDADKVLSSIFG
jgi:hypothetical protein